MWASPLRSRRGECNVVSILLGSVRKVGRLHVLDVVADGIFNHISEVGVATQESGRESHVDAEHVLHHQYLTVASVSCTNTDGGDGEALGYLCGKFGGDFLEYYCEASGFLEQFGIGQKLFGFGGLAGTHIVSAEFIDALRCEAEVTHHRYAS